MKANPEKFQFIILGKTTRPEYNLLIDLNVIKKAADVEMLGLIEENKLSFEKHRNSRSHMFFKIGVL